MKDVIWDEVSSVWLTSFWGWSPETWGAVGFTSAGRRDTILRKTPDPFIMVIYVTKNAPNKDPDIRGKITGFYLVSHIEGHRNDFTSHNNHTRNKDKWVYSLKVLRAFSFLPEYRLEIDAFDPTIGPRARAVAAYGEELSNPQIKKLRRLPFVEVPVFGGAAIVDSDVKVLGEAQNKVKAGPVNRGGYAVPGEPLDTPKELYALRLSGDASAYLGMPAQGWQIFKIGLSMSPKMRLATFQNMMPRGAFGWDLFRSTRLDGHELYPSFEVAEAGERRMKGNLGSEGKWLGGEFYAATIDVFERAWASGRQTALSYAANR